MRWEKLSCSDINQYISTKHLLFFPSLWKLEKSSVCMNNYAYNKMKITIYLSNR